MLAAFIELKIGMFVIYKLSSRVYAALQYSHIDGQYNISMHHFEAVVTDEQPRKTLRLAFRRMAG